MLGSVGMGDAALPLHLPPDNAQIISNVEYWTVSDDEDSLSGSDEDDQGGGDSDALLRNISRVSPKTASSILNILRESLMSVFTASQNQTSPMLSYLPSTATHVPSLAAAKAPDHQCVSEESRDTLVPSVRPLCHARHRHHQHDITYNHHWQSSTEHDLAYHSTAPYSPCPSGQLDDRPQHIVPADHHASAGSPTRTSTCATLNEGTLDTALAVTLRASQQTPFKSCLKKKSSGSLWSDLTDESCLLHSASPPTKRFCFSDYILVGETYSKEDYERLGDLRAKLTPASALLIRQELNQFKREMEVHCDSQHHTHFYL